MKNIQSKPDIKLSFDGQIWNLLSTTTAPYLFIEVRNNAKYNAFYVAFDLKKAKFINKKILPEEPWWTSMVGATAETLVISQYHDQQNPKWKNIAGISIRKGQPVWQKEKVLLMDVEGNRVRLADDEESKGEWVDMETGKTVNEQDQSGPFSSDGYFTPDVYQEGSEHYGTVAGFLSGKDYRPVGMIEYLEVSNYIIISFYQDTGQGKESILILLNERGEIMLEEILGRRLSGLGRDTFAIIENYLILIRDKTTLLGYNLKK